LLNLAGNAIKFTERGEVVAHVEMDGDESDKIRLHFSVRDTGIGIPPDKHQMVFDAFAQADGSVTRRYGGTGLGLSISKQLVAMMNGHMWLESEAGEGSTFHFTAEFAQTGGRAAALAEGVRPNLAVLQRLQVLVVDDNATNRRILRDILRL